MANSNSVNLIIIFQTLSKTQISGNWHLLQLLSHEVQKNSLWKKIEFQNSIED